MDSIPCAGELSSSTVGDCQCEGSRFPLGQAELSLSFLHRFGSTLHFLNFCHWMSGLLFGLQLMILVAGSAEPQRESWIEGRIADVDLERS